MYNKLYADGRIFCFQSQCREIAVGASDLAEQISTSRVFGDELRVGAL